MHAKENWNRKAELSRLGAHADSGPERFQKSADTISNVSLALVVEVLVVHASQHVKPTARDARNLELHR